MRWNLSFKADPSARVIADDHYNRQKRGSAQFCPPARTLVLLIPRPAGALWISSAPIAAYVRHAWPGAWVCTAFRNEGAGLSSELIREAVAATRAAWGDPPPAGFVTFVDPQKTRRKRDPGRCFRRAGWEQAGWTKGGLVALRLSPERFDAPALALGSQIPMETA